MTRHAFVLLEQDLVVFWAPKAACSTLAEVIAFSVLPNEVLDAWDFDKGGPRLLLEKEGFLYDGMSARRLIAQHGYRSVAILRDPYDRLISAFVNKFVVKNDRPILRYADMEPFAFRFVQDNFRALRLWRKPELGSTWKGITFRQFVSTVCDIIDASDESQRHLNQHWNTQIPDGVRDEGFVFDHVYDLQSIDLFFDLLREKTGVDVEIPRRNASSYSADATGNFCDVNALKIVKKEAFSKACFIDTALQERVKQSFENDYFILKKAA
ncbi:MAG: sulfotransferase family 2 domain-containing protein [Pseudomonadota bacterium]